MDSALSKLVEKLAEYGPGFLFCAIFIVLFTLERLRNFKLSEKLHELGLASLKADMEHTRMYEAVKCALDILAKSGGKHG